MIICGVDIRAKEAILAIVRSENGEIEHIKCDTKKLALHDHEDTASLEILLKAIKAFANENQIEGFIIKSRQLAGKLAAGGITFKIETLFQLSGTQVSFVSPPTLAAFTKKSNVASPPESINQYQADAYRAAAWKLAKV